MDHPPDFDPSISPEAEPEVTPETDPEVTSTDELHTTLPVRTAEDGEPSLQLIPVAQQTLFYATFNKTGPTSNYVIGNMPVQVSAGSPALETNSNTSTYQAQQADLKDTTLTPATAPKVTPQPKNWKLKRNISKRTSTFPKTYTNTGSVPITMVVNGLNLTMQPGDVLTIGTVYGQQQMAAHIAANPLITVVANLTFTGPSLGWQDQATALTATSTGITATYQWTKLSGTPVVTFGTPTALNTTVQSDVAGNVVLLLTATLTSGPSTGQTVSLQVPFAFIDLVPVSPAGGPLATPTPVSCTLTGTATGATYAWTKGPGVPVPTFGTPTALTTTVTTDVAGGVQLISPVR